MSISHASRGSSEYRSWERPKAGTEDRRSLRFGRVRMEKHNAEQELTSHRLMQLHESLKSCPNDKNLLADPKGLNVELMPHQKRALVWLLWRESQNPSGGILADDMGLGKTLSMISLIIKTKDTQNHNSNSSRFNRTYSGGTLVVCPASLINQWHQEIANMCKKDLLSVELYHGINREDQPERLAEFDVVITTYMIIVHEYNKNGTVFSVNFKRIILDEAHQVRNHITSTSQAVCNLSGQSRWAITGTPIHNKQLDMYALLKFLRCSPFDNLTVWKRWIGDKSDGGEERLHTIISSLMLRRTKAELIGKGALNAMPERKWDLIPITLDKDEMAVYHKVLVFSRSLFAQFLHQRAQKSDGANLKNTKSKPNDEYFKMRDNLLRLNNVNEVSQHEILVLLMRLRQICCHPFLITQMLENTDDVGGDEINLLQQLDKLNLNDQRDTKTKRKNIHFVGLKEASKGFLNPSNPVFNRNRMSSKIKKTVELLKKKIPLNKDKAIVVSQWRGYLAIIGEHLNRAGISFEQLDGTVPVNQRMSIINNINDPKDKTRVLLLSLTAGGVGLNLIGANHLILLDMHWNPQLENQAQDRIYRIGQKKPVFIYKFMVVDTIEQRIKNLQDNKLEIAESILTGSKQISNKLTLHDLKMLFDLNET